MTTPPRRLVAVGASNLTRGFPTLAASLCTAAGPDAELFAALGLGRSYGMNSRVLARTLPSILDCGLWRALAAMPPAPTRAVVTDVGNDILYGAPSSLILEWVAEVVDRLRRTTPDVVITGLPLASLRQLSNARFLAFRTVFYPPARVTRMDAIHAAEQIDEGLQALADSPPRAFRAHARRVVRPGSRPRAAVAMARRMARDPGRHADRATPLPPAVGPDPDPPPGTAMGPRHRAAAGAGRDAAPRRRTGVAVLAGGPGKAAGRAILRATWEGRKPPSGNGMAPVAPSGTAMASRPRATAEANRDFAPGRRTRAAPLSGRVGGAALAACAVLAVSALDYVSGFELRVHPLYYLPIAFAAWYVGRGFSVATAAVSTVLWMASNYYAGLRFSSQAVWVFNAAMHLASFLVVGLLIAQLKAALAHERELSRTDALTGLLNRRAFHDEARRVLSEGRRKGRPVTLAYVDLDDFKSVNDRLGHHEGDTTLKKAAAAIRRSTRISDVAARVGGDEFVLLFPETGADAARGALDRLRASLAQGLGETGPVVTASIGAVVFDDIPDSVEEIIRVADQRMYMAKAAGKDRIQLDTAVAAGAVSGTSGGSSRS